MLNRVKPASPEMKPQSPLSPTIVRLGLVSLFTDISSEMVYPLGPIFVTKVLGAPAWTVGVIEGVAESTAGVMKLVSGRMSDRSGRRKPLTVAGYSLGAISKPIIAISHIWPQMLCARFLDRLGKGLRASPRDALIAENCSPDQRGRAFGLHRSMDTTGAVLGPLLGYVFLKIHAGAYRTLYALAFVPGLLGVLMLTLGVRERKPEAAESETKTSPVNTAFSWHDLAPGYRAYLGIVAVFSAGNSSDAFLLLRAGSVGVKPDSLLLLYATFNIVEAVLGYTAGRLSDRVGRRPVIAAGYVVFALVYLGFALVRTPAQACALFVVYGLYYTLTQGTQKALAADLVDPRRRAGEMGAFHMLVGLAALPASLIAGWLYAHVAPAAPFFFGGAMALVAAVVLMGAHLGAGPNRGGLSKVASDDRP